MAARRLLASLGSATAVRAASTDMLRQLLKPKELAAFTAPPQAALSELTARTWDWLQATPLHQVLTLGDPAYPRMLLRMADPPLLLYAIGHVDFLQHDMVALVGSRNPTPQGRENAQAFARSLSQAGLTVVSGLALGVDGAAHTGALEGRGGTVAIVGTGLDRVYPRHHRDLAHRIIENGAMVSEYPLGTPPLSANFPKRNRIIAGLSLGTLVVEAAVKSGSLITAGMANEMGREVLAIPGSIHAPQSRGCHALIKQGAKLVECVQDVLDELEWQDKYAHADSHPAGSSDAGVGANIDPVLGAMGFDPVALDALCARTGLPPSTLNARLLELELAGDVARLPGQLFQRVSAA